MNQSLKVVIFRDPEAARKWGVEVGVAYIDKGLGDYEYICKVDLALSNEELAKQFGVESK